ncbi:hypothetical protein [Dyadobacter bucti]|uniref:hypothetical protein n=1 Tax=Dyadobacter bucti TaxID=2572203 RepID=UPI00110991CD|nr:hypothetical protein [Dyadobacter bucti]
MKYLVFILLFSATASAQVFVNGANINTVREIKVIELIVLEDFVASPNITASIDYGQERKELEGKITNAAGEKVKFGSIVWAINYLENRGWEYVNNSIIQKGRGVIYRYYFRRKSTASDGA